MKQKCYEFDIVTVLLERPMHVREIARELNTNSMTVLRKLKDLHSSNIVDFKKKGKNDEYFIKKSIEGKEFVCMTEHYKLIRFLQKYPLLRRVIGIIRDDKRFRMAILFGSYAKGYARKESDIDVYINTMDRKIKQDLQYNDGDLSIKIGKYSKSSPLLAEIRKKNIIIKGVEDYYERTGFFE